MSGPNAFGASANYLRLVIDTISVMAWIALPDGTLEFVNRPWLDYAGLSMEEALADPAPDAAVLIIEDNGVGMPQAPRQGPPGYGLLTNRERAESVRGTFAVGPRPGGGTRLCVRVPVRCTFSSG